MCQKYGKRKVLKLYNEMIEERKMEKINYFKIGLQIWNLSKLKNYPRLKYWGDGRPDGLQSKCVFLLTFSSSILNAHVCK